MSYARLVKQRNPQKAVLIHKKFTRIPQLHEYQFPWTMIIIIKMNKSFPPIQSQQIKMKDDY